MTLGIAPDLKEAARTAVREAIASLTAARGLTPSQAYILCSVCGDLRITEIVDAPNWVVGFYLPRVSSPDGRRSRPYLTASRRPHSSRARPRRPRRSRTTTPIATSTATTTTTITVVFDDATASVAAFGLAFT